MKEIGERGKPRSKRGGTSAKPQPVGLVSEGLPPAAKAPAKAPAPVRASAPAPVPAPAGAQSTLAPATPEHNRHEMSSTTVQLLLDHAKVESARLEARFEKQREDEAKLRLGLTPAPPQELISAEELVALQLRLEQLHAANLLSDSELHGIEDTIADVSELRQSMLPSILTAAQVNATPGHSFAVAAKLLRIAGAFETFTSDASLARQLKRKYV
jgi:hypothetical protein